ncbi:MAG TPA: DUF6542 domain-containing protein [Mycobacterium sp.]|nr:DUF6542 domain-containing protein [Mycobacterium sp.]
MSAQRARSAVSADHRSAHPNVPGIPWWGAVLLAVTATAMGFAYDAGSGDKELSLVFAAAYVIGCVAAVLAVRQSGIFSSVIQPPLILFVSVPAAYFLFQGAEIGSVKDTLINCGYPLIERFPLMFFTSAGVLLIGMARWYYGMSTRRASSRSAAQDTTSGGLTAAVTSKMSSLLTREDSEDDEEATESPRRRRSGDRSSRTATDTKRGGKPVKRSMPSRSRHTRPPETEVIEPVVDRPRRARSARQTEQPPVPPSEPRRKPRSSSTQRRSVPPTERRTGYERPERRRQIDDYEPLEPHGRNGNGTHHPVSRVRYRGAPDSEDRAEYRSPRRRTPPDWEADRWEYDI